MPGGRNLSGNEKFIFEKDKTVAKKKKNPSDSEFVRPQGKKSKKGSVMCVFGRGGDGLT